MAPGDTSIVVDRRGLYDEREQDSNACNTLMLPLPSHSTTKEVGNKPKNNNETGLRVHSDCQSVQEVHRSQCGEGPKERRISIERQKSVCMDGNSGESSFG